LTPTCTKQWALKTGPDFAPNSVARVMQRGFKLGDRLLRPAKVMVKQ